MSFKDSSGNNLLKAELLALATAQAADTVYKFNENVYRSQTQDGGRFEGASFLWYRKGQTVKQSEIDALFTTATFDTIVPATGPAAGGTPVVITGTNLSGAEGVTFGGTAATAFKVVSDTKITCTTPAKTAATYNVVVTDDAGAVTKTSAFIYV